MKKTGVRILTWAFTILMSIGWWFGFLYIDQVSAQTVGMLEIILIILTALLAGLFLNIVLHEAGHLIGGRLTGYSFVFFNVFNISIMKENGKLAIKRYRVPGISGGCSLSPPDMNNGTYPHKLYISGGFLMNFLVSAVCLSLFYYLAGTADLWARAFLVIGAEGAFIGIVNLIPQNVILPSDGYILFNLGKEKNAAMRRGCWTLWRIQALTAEGVRPRDIPEELFDWADASDTRDTFALMAACKRYEYLLDTQELDKAKALIKALCADLDDAPQMIKMPLRCEFLFYELIDECRQEEIDRLYDKDIKKYIKIANREPSVQRFMYAYARLVLKDDAKAKEYLDAFHKSCAIPFQSGIAHGEQELIALIDTIADKRGSS